MPQQSQQVVFRQNLLPLQGMRLVEQALFNSTLVEVIMHWPANCNGLVDIAMGIGNTQIYPTHGFIALNAATVEFRDNPIDVKRGLSVWVELQNHDGLNPHDPSILVTLREVADAHR